MPTWLVNITVDARCRRLYRNGLLDGHTLHCDLMRLVPDGLGDQPRREAGLLYRMEEAHCGLRVLAQLTAEPRVQALPNDWARSAEQRELTPLLDRLQPGSHVRYRIAANPTKRHGNSAPAAKRGKLATLHGADAENWWHRKALDAGLEPTQIAATSLPDVLGRPNHRRLTQAEPPNPNQQQRVYDTRTESARHGMTRFDGIATVHDPDRLRAAVTTGIGRARTYGCGLLSLAPLGESP